MESGTVHFSIGSGFGVTLMQIAQEHLLYGLDPQKALDTIQKSLMGCPEDIAKEILIGNLVLPVNEETQEVICVERQDFHDGIFPKVDLRDWFNIKLSTLIDGSESLVEQLFYYQDKARRDRGIFMKGFDYRNIFEFLKGNVDPVLEELYEDEELCQLGDLIRVARNFIENGTKLKEIARWLNKAYNLNLEFDDLGALSSVMSELQKLLNVSNVQAELESIRDDAVTKYIQNVQKIEEILSKGIEPVDILDKYDAGWLSPDGEYYALNGEIANMLHTQIADALQEKGIIPQDEASPDSWLEKHGWCRIHDNNVQFAGNLNSQIGGENVYLTNVQKEKITKYISDCHQCTILLGWKRQPYSVGQFRAMDKIALHKHFEF